jgi:hypothetical protein
MNWLLLSNQNGNSFAANGKMHSMIRIVIIFALLLCINEEGNDHVLPRGLYGSGDDFAATARFFFSVQGPAVRGAQCRRSDE